MIFTNSIYKNNEVPFYSIQALEETKLVSAFYTTSDVSDWKYGNGNWSRNYELLSRQLNLKPCDVCTTCQTHTSTVRVIKKENGGEGVLRPVQIQDYDGVVTNEKNLLLCSFEADCVPVYFLDPKNKAIGLSHSGWKGTAKEICKETISVMKKNYGTEADDLIVCIGPCACEKCYEVGNDLIPHFKEAYSDNLDKIFIPKNNDKFFLDLKSAIEITLIRNGVLPKNIFSVNACTIESKNLCSFRRTKSTTAHMLTAICLS